uniref:Uncharacterized protein n=1 Tax=Rhizophora mucronata TaxID=61149 RepID=A0A2P2KL51_RHIMU
MCKLSVDVCASLHSDPTSVYLIVKQYQKGIKFNVIVSKCKHNCHNICLQRTKV